MADCHRLAARAGVDPWDYSLKELVWRAEEIQYDEWDRVAWLCLHMPRLSGEVMTIDDFHPIRIQEKKNALADIDKGIADVKELLPDELSEDEIERQWQEQMKCQQTSEQAEQQ